MDMIVPPFTGPNMGNISNTLGMANESHDILENKYKREGVSSTVSWLEDREVVI